MPRRVIKKLNRIKRSTNVDIFDPNAIDADGDGLVQDATRFERPKFPGGGKQKPSGRISRQLGTSRPQKRKPRSLIGSMGRVVTPEMRDRNNRIIDKYNAGESPSAIAESESMTSNAVGWVLNQARKRGSVTTARSTNKKTPEIIERNKRILDQYNSGASLNDIAKTEQITRNAVSLVLTEARQRGELTTRRATNKKKNRNIESGKPTSQIVNINDEVARLQKTGINVPEIAQELNISENTVLQAILSNSQKRRSNLSRRAIYGSMSIPSEKPKEKPSKRVNRTAARRARGSITASELDQIKATPKSPVRTSGMITGAMANENRRIGTKIKTTTQVTKLPDGSHQVNIKYGDIDVSFEAPIDNYSSWVDAYDSWVGWQGNYSMRVASAALMNEDLPDAAGYNGDDEGTHRHDLISTGKVDNPSRSEINGMKQDVQNAVVALHHINSGKEINTRPIYRGLSNTGPNSEILKMGKGSIITMPLSAFTSDIGTAKYYAVGGDPNSDGVIIEVLPGAKVGDAAGDEYLHEFQIDGQFVVDVTESVTQGRFRYVGTSTSFAVGPDGKSRKITKVTLEQVETYNPLTGKFIKNTGKNGAIKGSISSSSKKDRFIERVGSIRPIVETLVPNNVESMHAQAVQNYINRNPIFINQLAEVNLKDNWKDLPEAINPDGSQMTKAQYIAYLNTEHRIQAQDHLTRVLNKYSPEMNDNHLRQLRYNLEFMFASSPQLQKLCEVYGYPQYAIFTKQQIFDKTGKASFVTTKEATEKNMPGIGRGVTLMNAGISAILPFGDDAFLENDGGPVLPALSRNEKRLKYGEWGIAPESYLNFESDDPLAFHKELVDDYIARYRAAGKRMDNVEKFGPIGTLRHETSHSIHASALAKAMLDVLADPSNKEKKERLALLSVFNKMSWEFAMSADRELTTMMIQNPISDYAATTPPEWLAETLSAALSPYSSTRALIGFNHRAILALAFPELKDYLVDSDWP